MAEWKLRKRHVAYVIGRDGAGRVSGHKLDLHSNVPEQILVLASESWSCNRKAERRNQIADTHTKHSSWWSQSFPLRHDDRTYFTTVAASCSPERSVLPTDWKLVKPCCTRTRMIVLLLNETLHQKSKQILQEAGAGLQLHNNNQTTSDARASYRRSPACWSRIRSTCWPFSTTLTWLLSANGWKPSLKTLAAETPSKRIKPPSELIKTTTQKTSTNTGLHRRIRTTFLPPSSQAHPILPKTLLQIGH